MNNPVLVCTKFCITRALHVASLLCATHTHTHTHARARAPASTVCTSWLWPQGMSQYNCRKTCLSHLRRRDNYTVITKQ